MKVTFMKYESELKFFMNYHKNLNIFCRIIKNASDCTNDLDIGFRRLINPAIHWEEKTQKLLDLCQPNKIYRLLDEFMFRYLLIRLPDTETPAFIIVGPYCLKEITQKALFDCIQKYSLSPETTSEIEKIFYSAPVVASEHGLLAAANTLGEYLWGGINNFSLQEIHFEAFLDLEPVAERPVDAEPIDAFLSMKVLSDRYAGENRLMQAVAQGQIHKAELLISRFNMACIEKRTIDPIRNFKNYLIIANTIMRKAAEAGTVHPLHIDSLSTRFAQQIEQARTEEALRRLLNDMVRKYCLLVKNHSMKGYSLLIRKILVRIDSDLTADLSLKAQADFLEVNSSYLSTLFKKETGTTLTEYVNRKRIEHGIFLLNTTHMQIQTIAQCCGIPDVNYFTKTFKKIVGRTPKEYRNHVSPYSPNTADIK